MLLKKETRFVFLLISFLGQLHFEFTELVDCAVRFRARMLTNRTLAKTLKAWREDKSAVATLKLS